MCDTISGGVFLGVLDIKLHEIFPLTKTTQEHFKKLTQISK